MEKKNILITGATGGIGSEICKRLVLEGNYNLILSGTNMDKLNSLKTRLQNKNIMVLEANLRDMDTFINKINKLNMSIDILINNAGITRDNLLLRMSNNDINDVMQVNLISTILLTKALVKNMIKQRYGRIISISSVVGFTGNIGQSNYASTKAGIVAFSKSLAQEVASRGITVNVVAPGFIKSPMTDNLDEQVQNNILSKIPAGRFGFPEEIANAVNFLVSNESAYITGSTIHVNGGLAMI